MSDLKQSDPLHHSQKLKQMINETADHAREDVSKISDPKAQALFETTAEVLKGLAKAFDDYEQKERTSMEVNTLTKNRILISPQFQLFIQCLSLPDLMVKW